METRLVIDDDYVTSVGRNCRQCGAEILDGTILADYISILRSIEAKAIISGNVNDALNLFIESTVKMKGALAEISENLANVCDAFADEIDSVDQYTF